MVRILLVLLFLTGLVFGGFFIFKNRASVGPAVQTPQTESVRTDGFGTPKKSLHYESNIPEHGSTLPANPVNVVINFNFDLSSKSSIEIAKDGKEYGLGDTVIDSNKLAMRRNFSQNAPDGIYAVTYNACWPDGSCHDGSFKFSVDRTKSASFTDMTGQKEVTVHLTGIAFVPQNIRVSAGTKIVWVNDEPVGHYVNTDPHAGHNYYPAQNSALLQNGDTYSYTFGIKGYYPYHCSAHADVMKGAIVVE